MTGRNEFLYWIMITAVEQGIYYWAAVRNYKHSDENEQYSASAILYDTVDGNKRYPLNFSLLEKGIAKIKEPTFQLREDILTAVLLADRTNGDQGDIDSEAADCIVQAGLFGEVIYG